MRAFLMGVVVAMAAACGAPSSLELCHRQCDASRKCGGITDAEAANCHTNCDAMKGALADQDAQNDKNCKNAADVRGQAASCLGQECNKVNTCLGAIDTTCVQR